MRPPAHRVTARRAQDFQQRALARPVRPPVKLKFCMVRAADISGAFADPVRRRMNAYFTGQANDAHHLPAFGSSSDREQSEDGRVKLPHHPKESRAKRGERRLASFDCSPRRQAAALGRRRVFARSLHDNHPIFFSTHCALSALPFLKAEMKNESSPVK
jgi:hypothetical protein